LADSKDGIHWVLLMLLMRTHVIAARQSPPAGRAELPLQKQSVCYLQVEQMCNKLLDESDRFREDMGDITENVSQETVLETAWDELESKTGAVCGAWRALHSLCMSHSAGVGVGCCHNPTEVLHHAAMAPRHDGDWKLHHKL
jgi:hypothetical protein